MAHTESALQVFVKKNGGTAGVSKMLRVQRSAIYAWLDKTVLPRPVVMQRIVKLSKGAVSYDALISDYARRKPAKSGKAGKKAKAKMKKRLH